VRAVAPAVMNHRLILTGASPAYASSLLALIGSMEVNWPSHPPLRVYDLGLGRDTLDALSVAGLDVVRVPPFCPHWRRHFTWKLWAIDEAPARDVLWLDAGTTVLQPLDEVFDLISRLGYFAVPNYCPLVREASEQACRACGVEPTLRNGRTTITSGVIGFRKEGVTGAIVKEAHRLALSEENVAATDPGHRHDQALLSLLLYRDLGDVQFADGHVYAGWLSPRQTPGQKIWNHRRALLPEDVAYYTACLGRGGAPHQPRDLPRTLRLRAKLRAKLWRLRVRTGDVVRAATGRPRLAGRPYDGVRD